MTNEIFPIYVQKQIKRLQPPGRPDIEKYLHNPMEQGRFLEKGLGDALYELKKRKKDLQEKINQYTNMHILAVDGQFPDKLRPAKYVVDALKIMKEIQTYTKETMAIVTAIQQTVQMYISAIHIIQGYFQARLNALATLLNEICNFRLPGLPSIPNFFNIFHFDGFKFPKGTFNFKLNFDKSFAFNQCKLRPGNTDIFKNYPKSMQWDNNTIVTNPVYNPPLGGSYYDTNGNTINLDVTSPPYYSGFDPNTDMIGGFPNPANIVSNYHMPLEDYISRLSSITGIVTYLQDVVNSGYDPNYVNAWIILLTKNREARKGQWLPRFQAIYDSYIFPSFIYLSDNGIVWNNKLGGSGTQAGSQDIPIIKELTHDNATYVGQLLYMLTFLEASLLGCSRNKNYDSFVLDSGTTLDLVVSNFLSDFTDGDLDYIPYNYSLSDRVSITLDSQGKAQYPSIIDVPRSLMPIVDEIILTMMDEIENKRTYIGQRSKYRYVYDNMGEQILVDKYSQYWREVADKWNTLISLNDSYNDLRILKYQSTIQEKIDPLVPNTDNKDRLILDGNSRDRLWIPGTYTLPYYKQDPLELYPISEVSSPDECWDQDTFIEDKYLLRADIQGLTLNQKLTMLQINRAYSSMRATTQAMLTSLEQGIADAQDVLSNLSGFKYDIDTSVRVVDSGTDLVFQVEQVDQTNWYLDGIHFIAPVDGSYSISGTCHWDTTGTGVRILSVIKNDIDILDTNQTEYLQGPTNQEITSIVALKAGDSIKLRAYHNCLNDQTVTTGEFSAFIINMEGTLSPTPPTGAIDQPSNTRMAIAASDIQPGMCIKINTDKTVSVILPTDPDIAPYIDGIALGAAAVGNEVEIAYIHGDVYEISNGSYTSGPIFLGIDGIITQTQPLATDGYTWYVQVGRAVGYTTILMDSQLPIQIL